MKWVTRERPKIDRIACPWLIARFIDPGAEFLYVPAADVLRVAKETSAIPYDIPDVEYGHHGELRSFDTFLDNHNLTDPALRRLAVIVRGADTGRLDLAPQSAGLLALSLGLSKNFANDHEMLRYGMVIYDVLYTWVKNAQGELIGMNFSPKSAYVRSFLWKPTHMATTLNGRSWPGVRVRYLARKRPHEGYQGLGVRPTPQC